MVWAVRAGSGGGGPGQEGRRPEKMVEQAMAGGSRYAGWAAWKARFTNRIHARLAGMGPAAAGFVAQPEPRSIGSFARGRQMMAGNFHFAGYLVEAPESRIWDLSAPDPAFAEALHGFAWLDDLAAVGDAPARDRARDWTFDWIARFGRGKGPGWAPDLTGRRLIRWVNHAPMLLGGDGAAAQQGYFRALGRQIHYLSRRWPSQPAGLPRFEALTGLICSTLSLRGMERYLNPAVAALARECERQIDSGGGIASRNPEELLEIATLLMWAAQALSEAGRAPPSAQMRAIERIVPTLRLLRHADGGLARFHGGDRGAEGRLDEVLAHAGLRNQPPVDGAMGYARLAAGRSSVIVDAAAPPAGSASANAHASTLAFELTSGRRAVIVNCGPGGLFGPDWHRAGRATASHSTLAIEGFSSSRLGGGGLWGNGRGAAGIIGSVAGRRDQFGDLAAVIHARQSVGAEGVSLLLGHSGYAATHGLTHMRGLVLSRDGRQLAGEDTLGALSDAERSRFEAVMNADGMQGVAFALRFHLHPDVDASIDMGGTAVSLALRSGELWVFRHDGHARLALDPSVYLEKGRLKPRPSRQIVLSSRVVDYACQIRWTLSKAEVTPLAIRDLVRDDDPAP